jgi:ATP-dependent Clp protease adaptor protein ClpS
MKGYFRIGVFVSFLPINFASSNLFLFSYFCGQLKSNTKVPVQEQILTDLLEAIEITDVRDLIVFNDDFNTFEHVIETLIRVCKHTPEQAEQCTWLIHHKGKCKVKAGSYEELNPMREAICDAGIDAKIV